MNFSELKIKVLGPTLKPVRRATDLIDGDGDGICEESEGLGVPCPPKVRWERIQQMWNQRQARRLEARRATLKRVQERQDPWGKRTPMSMGAIRRAAEAGQYSTIEAEMKRLFDIDDLGGNEGVKSRVVMVEPMGDLPGSNTPDFPMEYGRGIQVTGEIYDEDDNQIGDFVRIVLFDNETMYHELLEITDEDSRGQGIGSDFITATESRYHKLGLKDIKVHAALKDGPYTWAVAGFDWEDETERGTFLSYMLSNIGAYRKGTRPELFESQQEALELEQLVLRAMDEDFNDPNRLTPYIFTLYKGAREGLTRQSISAADRRAWNGVRKVSTPSTVKVKQLASSITEILHVNIITDR